MNDDPKMTEKTKYATQDNNRDLKGKREPQQTDIQSTKIISRENQKEIRK